MDCKIPLIYIASESQRSRMSMSKTRRIAICYHTNAKTPPCVSVRAVRLEYLGRYTHQTLVLYFIVNYFILLTSCITVLNLQQVTL
jgi:hypothetical protein